MLGKYGNILDEESNASESEFSADLEGYSVTKRHSYTSKPEMKLAFALLIGFLLFIYFEPAIFFPFLAEARIALILSSASFCISFLAGGRPPRIIQTWLFLGLFIIASIGLVVSPFPYTHMNESHLNHLYKAILFYFLVAMVLGEKDRITKFIYLTFFLMGVVCLVSILTARAGIEPLKGGNPYRMKNFFGGIGDDPNEFGVALVAFIPLAFCFFREEKSKVKKAVWLLLAVLFLLGVFRTRSRGAFLGLITIGVLFLWEYRRDTKMLLIVLFIMLASMFHVHEGFWKRISTLESQEAIEDDYSAHSRITQMKYCLGLMAERPLTGVGLGSYHPAKVHILGVQDQKLAFMAPHNSYLSIGAETGVIGFLLFVTVILVSIHSLRHSQWLFKSKGESYLEGIAKGIRMGLIGLAVCIFFLTEQYNILLYQGIGISAALAKIASGEAKKA